jgi:phenylalanyl-tRNA synthetase alpha chain
MPSDIESLTQIESQARTELDAVADEDALERWRVTYLGRRGRLTLILRGLAGLPLDERKSAGQRANRLKGELEAAFQEKKTHLARSATDALIAERIDVTLPGPPLRSGRLHPTTQTLRDVLDCFASMGFQAVEGPEIEWDHYNFEALRIPKDHPARDMWDTLWIDYEKDGERPMLLRTHTSPMQIRIMEQTQPPIRVVIPGKCYRYEATDPTHEWMMTQVEGLAVDEGISMTDLKGTLADFARRIFGPDRKIGFRCDYFPFVEPGMELRIDCFLCGGRGCRTCSHSGWIEILGAGMVHPEMLEAVGYDSERYTGFAFGMGIERIAMLRHGIEDIRLFYSNDLRFLGQF